MWPYVSISSLLDVSVFNDVAVKMNKSEEIKTKRRSQSTEHPANTCITASQIMYNA